MSRRLVRGDVIAKPWGRVEIVLIVLHPGKLEGDPMLASYRKEQKARLLNLHRGTEQTAWWFHDDSLPRRYRVVGTLTDDQLDLIRNDRQENA